MKVHLLVPEKADGGVEDGKFLHCRVGVGPFGDFGGNAPPEVFSPILLCDLDCEDNVMAVAKVVARSLRVRPPGNGRGRRDASQRGDFRLAGRAGKGLLHGVGQNLLRLEERLPGEEEEKRNGCHKRPQKILENLGVDQSHPLREPERNEAKGVSSPVKEAKKGLLPEGEKRVGRRGLRRFVVAPSGERATRGRSIFLKRRMPLLDSVLRQDRATR